MARKFRQISAATQLRSICFELDALAYLLRLKRKDDLPPFEIEEINYGTGRILERLTNRVKRVMRDMEDADIAESKLSRARNADLETGSDR